MTPTPTENTAPNRTTASISFPDVPDELSCQTEPKLIQRMFYTVISTTDSVVLLPAEADVID